MISPFVFLVQEDPLLTPSFCGEEQTLGFTFWEGLSFPTGAWPAPNGLLTLGWRMDPLAKLGEGRRGPSNQAVGSKHRGPPSVTVEPKCSRSLSTSAVAASEKGGPRASSYPGVALASPETVGELARGLQVQAPLVLQSSSARTTHLLTGGRCASMLWLTA